MNRVRYWQYGGPVIVLSVATVFGFGLTWLPEPYASRDFTNLGMIYLVATVFSAANWGLVPSIITAIGGFLLYHTIFREPTNVFGFNDPNEFINLMVFAATSLGAVLIGTRFRHKLEKERLEYALQKERREREREELRASLLASVTHDLKTPLASVIGSLSSLRHVTSLNQKARQTLIVTAHEEAQRLNDFISNILNLTRLESGTIELDQGWHHPTAVVYRVLKQMRHRTWDRKIFVNEPAEPVQFFFDSHLIEQVIQNLVDNAVKYGDFTAPITINIAMQGEQGIISVTNAGPGIPKESREHIFDKFYRVGKRDSSSAGTGLGLSICRTIMTMHQGAIILSEPLPDSKNPGTCFTLIFPAARRTEESAAAEILRYA